VDQPSGFLPRTVNGPWRGLKSGSEWGARGRGTSPTHGSLKRRQQRRAFARSPKPAGAVRRASEDVGEKKGSIKWRPEKPPAPGNLESGLGVAIEKSDPNPRRTQKPNQALGQGSVEPALRFSERKGGKNDEGQATRERSSIKATNMNPKNGGLGRKPSQSNG